MSTPRWNHLSYQGTEVRWRHDGQEHANPSSGYDLETRHGTTGEWREVRNYNSRDWFAIGMMARREQGGGEGAGIVANHVNQGVLAL